MRAIHQFVAGFTLGDAISNETLIIRKIIRAWGAPSEIFCEAGRISPSLRREAIPLSDYAGQRSSDDVVLLHVSIGSRANELFAQLDCGKALLYHNITPASYFDVINKQIAFDLAKGRRQLEALAGVAEVNLADSRFNARELEALGYRNPQVLPLLLDLGKLTEAVDRKILRKCRDSAANVLFVGRCAPNKKIEDILRAFAYFHHCVNPQSRFVHAGSFAGTERYYYWLLAMARDLGIEDAVHFAGAVTQPELNAYYASADLFLCMSEHEGFCIPIIEAMVHDVPILAYSAGAVPETLDGSGVIVKHKRYNLVSEMMGRLIADQAFRGAVIAAQRQRLQRYRARDLDTELRRQLAPILNGG